MEGLVAGAALGAAFEMLFVSAHKLVGFGPNLNRLKSTLSDIKLVIDDIDRFNNVLDRPQQETIAFVVRLIEGEKLVQKWSNVGRWNVCMRLYYSMKLSQLEASIASFFQVNVAALHFRESRRVSATVSNLEDKINEILIVLNTLLQNEIEKPS